MKAIVQERYGSTDVLELEDIDKPEIGDDDVLVRVLAASAHIGDWHFMTGLPYLFRIAGSGPRASAVPPCWLEDVHSADKLAAVIPRRSGLKGENGHKRVEFSGLAIAGLRGGVVRPITEFPVCRSSNEANAATDI